MGRHPEAALAAETAFRLGGSRAFWKFHDKAFIVLGKLDAEHYEQWAVEAGVDKALFKAAFDKQEYAAKVEADQALGKALGITGVPATYINGVFLSGSSPLEKLAQVIDGQLVVAEAAISGGTPPDKVYRELVAENLAKSKAEKERREKLRSEGVDDESIKAMTEPLPSLEGPP